MTAGQVGLTRRRPKGPNIGKDEIAFVVLIADIEPDRETTVSRRSTSL